MPFGLAGFVRQGILGSINKIFINRYVIGYPASFIIMQMAGLISAGYCLRERAVYEVKGYE